MTPFMASRLPALILAAYSLLLGGLMVLSGRIPARANYDHKLYHEPTIRQFAEQWPHIDLWHYKSATTPGYHLLQAAVATIISPSLLALQLTAMAITAALSYLLGRALVRHAPPLLAVALGLPLASSIYIAQSSAYLLPDNLGWLGVLGMLLLVLRPRQTAGVLLGAAAVLLALVMVRQIHAWTAGLLWLGAWLNSVETPGGPLLNPRAIFHEPTAQARRALLALLATLPALVLLALFYRYWGGLVPPVFQGWYHSGNAAGVVFVLAVFGAFSPFFLVSWWPGLRTLWAEHRLSAAVILLLLLVVACAVPTTHDLPAGRFSGLWNLAAKLPVVGHCSPFMVGLGVLGAVCLLSLAARLDPRTRLIFLGGVLGYGAACTANHDLFQRYVEPLALMLLALMSAMSLRGPVAIGRHAVGPLVLAAAFVAMTTLTLIKASVPIDGPPPAARSPQDPPVPAELPRPELPPGKRFF